MQTIPTEFAELTPKQVKCLPMLAVGLSASEVAKKAKVSQIQISSWKSDPNFMSALDSVRRNALRDAEAALTGLAMDAVHTIRESLKNASSEQTRLRAAIYVIDRLGFPPSMGLERAEMSGTVNMNLLLTSLGIQQVTQ